MQAGYNLNYDVATKVMGWSVDLIVNPVGQNFEEWRDPSGWRYGSQPPPFSTEIKCAWKVVEHMRDRRLYLHLNDTMSQYRCVFYSAEDTMDPMFFETPAEPPWAFADTVTLAICRAALAAAESLEDR